jgi:hypothetical protein
VAALSGCALLANLSKFDNFDESTGDDGTPGDATVDIEAQGGDDTMGGDVVDVADGALPNMQDGSADGGADANADADSNADADADAANADVVEELIVDVVTEPIEAGPCNSNWPEGGVNVVTDPDFQGVDGGGGWFALYGGKYNVSTNSHCGGNGGELSNRQMFYYAMATYIPTTPTTYRVQAWVMQDGDASAPMALGGVCIPLEGGTNYPAGPTFTALPNTWTFATGSMVVPAGCATMAFFVGQQMSATAYPDIFADEVYVGQ